MKTSRWVRFVACIALMLGSIGLLAACAKDKKQAAPKPTAAIASPAPKSAPPAPSVIPIAAAIKQAPAPHAAKKNDRVVGWVENVVLDMSGSKV